MFSVLGRTRDRRAARGTILEGGVRRERPGRDRADARDVSSRRRPTSVAHAVGEFVARDRALGWRRRRRRVRAARLMRRIAAERCALSAAHARVRRGDLRRRDASRTALASSPSSSPGILIGDAEHPCKSGIERFHTSLASLAEIVVFVALGLTIDLTALGETSLARRARPCGRARIRRAAARRSARSSCRRGCADERLFVMWSGLKGAVPILLAPSPCSAASRCADDLRDRLRRCAFSVGFRARLFHGPRTGSACRCGRRRPASGRRARCGARVRAGTRSCRARGRATAFPARTGTPRQARRSARRRP